MTLTGKAIRLKRQWLIASELILRKLKVYKLINTLEEMLGKWKQ